VFFSGHLQMIPQKMSELEVTELAKSLALAVTVL
jgi:hypothetical protein